MNRTIAARAYLRTLSLCAGALFAVSAVACAGSLDWDERVGSRSDAVNCMVTPNSQECQWCNGDSYCATCMASLQCQSNLCQQNPNQPGCEGFNMGSSSASGGGASGGDDSGNDSNDGSGDNSNDGNDSDDGNSANDGSGDGSGDDGSGDDWGDDGSGDDGSGDDWGNDGSGDDGSGDDWGDF